MKSRMLVVLVCLGLGFMARAALVTQTELLKNGSFDQVLEQWGVSSELGSWIPYQYPAGNVSTDPNVINFQSGPIITQPLNVDAVSNQSVTVAVDISSEYGVSDGHTVGIDLDYLDAAGDRHTVTVLNPDNSAIPSGGSAPFQQSYSFPADAARLVGLTVCKKTDQWGAFVDNVSLKTSSGLVSGPVPSLKSIQPAAVPYGGTVTIHGSNFGTVQGLVRVGGATNGVVVQSWSDNAITALIGEACAGGLIQVEALGARTIENRTLTISSPRFALEASSEQTVTLAGQVIDVDVLVQFLSGFSTTGGVLLSTPDHPGASTFSRNPVMRHGSSLLSFDTTGLSTGVHQIVIVGTASNQPPRETSFEVDIREVGSCTLDVDGTTFPSQSPQMASLTILDTEGKDISSQLPWPDWSSSAPSQIDVFQESAMWGSLYVLPHTTGSATLQATLPDGAVYSFGVTSSIPAAPSIQVLNCQSPTMSNDPMSTNQLYCLASSSMTQFSYSSDLGLQTHNSWWNGDSSAYTAEFTIGENVEPGNYMISATATIPGGGASDSYVLRVVNNPAMGLINGRVSRFGGDIYHGASGTLEFYDPAGGLLFDRQVWSDSSDFTLASVPPGNYHLRFVSDFGDDDWYPNADSNTAATVTVTAGAAVPGINFTIVGDQVIPDPEIVGAPGQTPGGGFGFSVQSEMNKSYQFRKSTTLRDGSWFILSSFWGDGSVVDLEDTNITTHAYYRVLPE